MACCQLYIALVRPGGFRRVISAADIAGLAHVVITKGCNPPVNDGFCSEAFVTRGRMAAFLHRARGG